MKYIEKQKAVETFEIPMDFLKKSNDKNSSDSINKIDIDDDDNLEALAASYSWDKGALWYWDIDDNKTYLINDQMGPYQIHDIDQIEIGNEKIILIFPENYNDDSPILTTKNNGLLILEKMKLYQEIG